MARDLLHDRNGTFAHERDGHRVGAYAVASSAGGREGCAEGGLKARDAERSRGRSEHDQ
jgi:hypothetical protein